MKNGFLRVVGLVLLWALVYAIPGGAIEALSNLGIHLSIEHNVDMWPQTLAFPGLVAGLVFAALVAANGRLRTLDASSLGLLAGLGVITGLIVGGIFASLGWIGGGAAPWGLGFGFTTVMGVAAAVASGLLLRYLARKQVSARVEA